MSSSEHKLSEKVAEGGMLDTGLSTDVVDHKNGAYAEIKDVENPELGMFDKPLPCFGCGIGWFSWVLTALLSMCACVFVADEFFCARVYVDQCTCFCSLLLGLVCPLLWYYATFLYFQKYYQRDPRERDGLAANAVAVSVTLTMFCSIDYLFRAMCDNLDNLLWMLFSLFRILK